MMRFSIFSCFCLQSPCRYMVGVEENMGGLDSEMIRAVKWCLRGFNFSSRKILFRYITVVIIQDRWSPRTKRRHCNFLVKGVCSRRCYTNSEINPLLWTFNHLSCWIFFQILMFITFVCDIGVLWGNPFSCTDTWWPDVFGKYQEFILYISW